MTNDLDTTHPLGERNPSSDGTKNHPIEVATFDGKLHIEWDTEAAVTPIGVGCVTYRVILESLLHAILGGTIRPYSRLF
ncbi:MAG: hypothetical protein ACI9Y1_001864 [Lentisphaeria bacterium]|jgi:hypothetical protein